MSSKRLLKEFKTITALPERIVSSCGALTVEFVHNVAEDAGFGPKGPSAGETVRWVARVWRCNEEAPVGSELGATVESHGYEQHSFLKQLVGAIVLDIDLQKYPFSAPQMSLVLPTAGSDSYIAMTKAVNAEGIAIDPADHYLVEPENSSIDALRTWSPAYDVKGLLQSVADLLNDGTGLPPWGLNALLSCGPTCAELWRRATSGSFDIVWLSFGSGLADGSALTRDSCTLDDSSVLGGEYYYQHMPARLQREIQAGKRVLVALVDARWTPEQWPPGFEGTEWTAEWKSAEFNAATGMLAATGVCAHVQLPVEVMMFSETFAEWDFTHRSRDAVVPPLASARQTVLSELAKITELWVSDFCAESDRKSTWDLSATVGSSLKEASITDTVPSRGPGGCDLEQAAHWSALVDSASGVKYLRAADGALASGSSSPGDKSPTLSALERERFFATECGRRHNEESLDAALRVAAWTWDLQ